VLVNQSYLCCYKCNLYSVGVVNFNPQQEMMADFDSEMRKREHEFHLKLDEMTSLVLSHELKVRPTSHQTSYKLYVRGQGCLEQWLSKFVPPVLLL